MSVVPEPHEWDMIPYMAGTLVCGDNGRICVPVKKEYKLKVPGSVMDKSSTGNTLFIEPAGVSPSKLKFLSPAQKHQIKISGFKYCL